MMSFFVKRRKRSAFRHVIAIAIFYLTGTLAAQPADTAQAPDEDFLRRQVVAIANYVAILPVKGGTSEKSAVVVEKSKLAHLVLYFQRQNLRREDGPQFIKVTTTLKKPNGDVYDKIVQYAFTFSKEISPDSDEVRIREYAQKILPFGFFCRRNIDSVDIIIDSPVDWALIKITVAPDENYTKYFHNDVAQKTWYYRAYGRPWETAFFFGIPKVLYDFNRKDSINYGNSSAILRLFLLNCKTGSPYPVNLGIGTLGINSPIDVTEKGGGFAISLFLDIFQVITSNFHVNFGKHFNGGIEVTPFFPINHHPHLLINARIGFSPQS